MRTGKRMNVGEDPEMSDWTIAGQPKLTRMYPKIDRITGERTGFGFLKPERQSRKVQIRKESWPEGTYWTVAHNPTTRLWTITYLTFENEFYRERKHEKVTHQDAQLGRSRCEQILIGRIKDREFVHGLMESLGG
jgi:hypothetical protein